VGSVFLQHLTLGRAENVLGLFLILSTYLLTMTEGTFSSGIATRLTT